MNNRDLEYIKVIPSQRQLSQQAMEFYAFIHFTVNTFTGKEWGEGTENPLIFNPMKLDATQWVSAVKSAGMKGIILTCKHHDGFCLWPSKYTEHSVKNSPYKDGQGDIVKEVSQACATQGIKFGVYLSPWDRNNSTYGYGDSYNDYFIKQLTELLTNYGDIFTVWFDGACGEGSNGKKQVYDWDRYYGMIRKLQPNACISVCGEDIRWCGNEAGSTRPSEWSVVSKRLAKSELVASLSQQSDEDSFRQAPLKNTDLDLGSRLALQNEKELIWYPAEVDTSIRPGWFYHEEEDEKVRSLDELINIYYNSVGGNAVLLLNIPPNKDGLIHQNDCNRLKEIGDYLECAFSINLAQNATFTSDTREIGYEPENMNTDSYEHYYKTNDGVTTAQINIKLSNKQDISHIVLKENINLSQRIESFEIYAKVDGEYKNVYSGTIIGYKKIVKVDTVNTDEIMVKIRDARVSVTLSFVGIY